jgi:hypothetical protein
MRCVTLLDLNETVFTCNTAYRLTRTQYNENRCYMMSLSVIEFKQNSKNISYYLFTGQRKDKTSDQTENTKSI